MKNNKALIIIGVILLNVLVVYMIAQSLMGKASQYEKTLEEARAYAEQELCSKSIAKYNEAIISKDTLAVRLEMIDVYEKGVDIGEFTNLYDVATSVTTMVDAFRDEVQAYEEACEFFVKYGKYEECANVLMQARDLHVTSEKIEEYRSQVRYEYTEYFSMYTNIQPVSEGMYVSQTENTYTYLEEDGSPSSIDNVSYATAFGGGYAIVKSSATEGEDRVIIINKSGERQAYLTGVEQSSGFGKAFGKGENTLYLAACKVGDVYKYYDTNGAETLGEYTFAGRFRNNVAAVKDSEGNWTLINGSGKTITDTVFKDVALNEFDECAAKGFIFASDGEKYHLYDLNGTQIGDFSCDAAKPFAGDYAAFKSGDFWGFVATDGTVVIEPQYEDAKSFSNSMGAVKIGESWAFINPNNEVVIDEGFEEVDYLNDKGICFVKSDGYWSYLKMYYSGK